MRLARALAFAALAAAGPASAELGPQRASDAVTLLSNQDPGSCPLFKGAFGFDTRVLVTGAVSAPW
jgi:hypothetical protein